MFNFLFKSMGFKPISAEQGSDYLSLLSQRFLQKRAVQGVLKRFETGDAKCQPRSGRKRKSTKRSLWSGFL